MADCNRCAKINVKVLFILILIAAALGTSLIAARHVRRRLRSEMELKAGEAAFDEMRWVDTNRHLSAYISLNADEIEVLKKLAKARASIRPINPGIVGGAIAAYRRILQLDPLYENAYDELAVLYKLSGNFEELRYIAKKRIDLKPGEIYRKAQMWEIDALIQLNKGDQARERLDEIIPELQPLEGEPAGPESEYVQACIRMSGLAALESNLKAAVQYLDDAIEGSDPNSVEALALRARLLRNDSVAARGDLEEADKIGTDNARILALLCEEWMWHGELVKAAAELEVAENLPRETLEKHYLNIDEWIVAKFTLESELALRKRNPAEAASLADKALEELKDARYRFLILDPSIRAYVEAGNVEDANSCLDDYLDALRGVGLTTEGALRIAYLKAIVAKVKGLPYAVIDILQPVLGDEVTDSKLWWLLAEAYSMTNQPRQAIRALERHLVLQPNNSQARLQKAAQHLRLGDWAVAREDARRAESLSPEGTDARLFAQLLRIEAGANIAAAKEQSGATKLKELRGELEELQKQHPDRVDIRILQAVVADRLGQPESAEAELKQAIEDFEEPDKLTDKLRAELQLVRHYRSRRDPRAIERCQDIRDSHPELAWPWLELSDIHIINGDPNSAREALELGLDSVATEAEKRGLSIKLALLELAHGDRAEGRELLQKLREQDKRDMQVSSWLLRLPEVLEDKETAEKLIEELREAEGESGLRWRFHRAVLLLEGGDVDTDVLIARQPEIEDHLEYCIVADPNWTAPVLRLGDMYSDIGDLQRAEDTYRRALIRDSAAPEVVNALMALLQRRGRLLDAEQLIDRLRDQFRISPQAASDWNLRLLALGAGDPDQAIEELKIRASNEPNDPNLPSELARLVYRRYGDFGQAKKYLDAARAKDPYCWALILAEVAILRAEERHEEAREALDTYVRNVPEDKVFNARVLRAAYLSEVGETEKAEDDYKELPTVAGQGAMGYFFLADFYMHNQDLDKAVKAYDDGLTAYSGDLRLKRGLVKALYSRGSTDYKDVARADKTLEELEKRLPNDPELMTIRAKRLLQLSLAGEDPNTSLRSQAADKLRRAIRLEPTAIEAQLLLINILMEDNEYEKAQAVSVRAIGSNPRSPKLAWKRAEIEARLQNPELAGQNTILAAQLSEAALQEDPNNPVVLNIFAAAALQSMDEDLCRKAAVRLEAFYRPEDRQPNVGGAVTLAKLHTIGGSVIQAGHSAERALQIEPDNSAMRDILAEAARLSGDNDLRQKAIARLETYCSTEEGRKGFAEALKLAELYRQSDNMGQAKQWAERAEQMDQIGLSGRVDLASILYKTGDAEGAKKLYKELLKQDPNNVRILNDLAWILQEHDKDYNAAIKLADKGVQTAGDDVFLCHLLDTRGTILLHMSRSADARKDFERLLTLSPTPAQEAKARLQLGRMCERLGEPAEARRHLERAQALDPQNEIFTDAERSEISRILQGSGI